MQRRSAFGSGISHRCPGPAGSAPTSSTNPGNERRRDLVRRRSSADVERGPKLRSDTPPAPAGTAAGMRRAARSAPPGGSWPP